MRYPISLLGVLALIVLAVSPAQAQIGYDRRGGDYLSFSIGNGDPAVCASRCEHDARHPKPSCLHKVGPAGGPSSTIPPCRRLLVEPAPVR